MSQIFNPEKIVLGHWVASIDADWPSDIIQITNIKQLVRWVNLWDHWPCGCVSSPDRFFTTYEEAIASLEDDWEEELDHPFVPCRGSDLEDFLLGMNECNEIDSGVVNVP